MNSRYSALWLDAEGASRIFNINDGASTEIDVTLSYLVVLNGATAGHGGGIISTENLALKNVNVSSNEAAGDGGGIYSTGTLYVSSASVSRNSAQNDGGGIYSTAAANLFDVTFYENRAEQNGGGINNSGALTAFELNLTGNDAFNNGGIYNSGAILVADSELWRNSTIGSGGSRSTIFNAGTAEISTTHFRDNSGGIFNSGDVAVRGVYSSNNPGGNVINTGTARIDASYIVGDRGPTRGPGLINSGTVTVVSTTFNGGDEYGGPGIRNTGDALFVNATILDEIGNTGAGSVTLYNSIVSEIESGNDVEPESSHNLILDPSSTGGISHDDDGDLTTGKNNIVGQADGVGGRQLLDIDTVLLPFADNGGPTYSRAPVSDSVVIDVGGPLPETASHAFDQRGHAFPRVVDSNNDGDIRADIGAIETPYQGDLIVSTVSDVVDGDYSDGELSLREAIAAATSRSGEEITFSTALTAAGPVIISLDSGAFQLSESLTISGPGSELVTIDAQGASRVFEVAASDTNVVSDAA